MFDKFVLSHPDKQELPVAQVFKEFSSQEFGCNYEQPSLAAQAAQYINQVCISETDKYLKALTHEEMCGIKGNSREKYLKSMEAKKCELTQGQAADYKEKLMKDLDGKNLVEYCNSPSALGIIGIEIK